MKIPADRHSSAYTVLSSAFSFRKLIPLLRNHYDIIAVDLPPFGQSEKSRTFVYTYANLAKLLIGLLEKLGISRALITIQWADFLIRVSSQTRAFSKIVLLCSSGYLKRSHPSIIFGTHLPCFDLYLKYWLSKTAC